MRDDGRIAELQRRVRDAPLRDELDFVPNRLTVRADAVDAFGRNVVSRQHDDDRFAKRARDVKVGATNGTRVALDASAQPQQSLAQLGVKRHRVVRQQRHAWRRIDVGNANINRIDAGAAQNTNNPHP